MARLEEALLDYIRPGWRIGAQALLQYIRRNGDVTFYGFGETTASGLIFSALLVYWQLKAMPFPNPITSHFDETHGNHKR